MSRGIWILLVHSSFKKRLKLLCLEASYYYQSKRKNMCFIEQCKLIISKTLNYFTRKIQVFTVMLFLCSSLMLYRKTWQPGEELTFAKHEVQLVSSYLDVDPVTGKDMTKQRFLGEIAKATVLHLGKNCICLG